MVTWYWLSCWTDNFFRHFSNFSYMVILKILRTKINKCWKRKLFQENCIFKCFSHKVIVVNCRIWTNESQFQTLFSSNYYIGAGPLCHSKSKLKHCIPIVYRSPSTVSENPKSILLPHFLQSICIDTFQLANLAKKLKFWTMHFLRHERTKR